MNFRIRPVRTGDTRALYDMAKLTGGGFTNLPPDKPTIEAKVERSLACFAREGEDQQGDLYMFVLEDPAQKLIRGTCQIFSKIGVIRPFYSYRISTLTQHSAELGKTFRNQTLGLTTDLEGSSEVGGLFLHPHERASGLGALLARSRYLFIREHRSRFGDKVIAELRGVIDQAGNSPFWDGLAGRFFGMTFPEADQFNATHGTQFIADLMPKTPIYIALLAEAAQAVIAKPHPTGRAAMRMLEEEGFYYENYVDIFDGGPTLMADTDDIRTVRDAQELTVSDIGREGEEKMLLAAGRLQDFVACYGHVTRNGNEIAIGAETAELLGVTAGDRVVAVER
jgi:arginine N-succinyltransferase